MRQFRKKTRDLRPIDAIFLNAQLFHRISLHTGRVFFGFETDVFTQTFTRANSLVLFRLALDVSHLHATQGKRPGAR
jgi:hypothetical protein